MIPDGLAQAIIAREAAYGKLNMPIEDLPDWNQLVPYFDQSFLKGNKRAVDPHEIRINVDSNAFPIVRELKVQLAKIINNIDIGCCCCAGFSPNATSSPPHKDPTDVFFVVLQGSVPWKIFEHGCNYNENTGVLTSRSTFSRELTQAEFRSRIAYIYYSDAE